MSASTTSIDRREPAITSQDIRTVADATVVAGAAETVLYVAADISTGGLLTVFGFIVGVVIAANEKDERTRNA